MLSNEVTVHVNREASDTLELEYDGDTDANRLEVEISGSFILTFRGHGTPAHVHCRLDGDLSRIASIDQPNYYVGPNDVTPVAIEVDSDAVDDVVEGRLEVLTGYGSESVVVDVTVTNDLRRIDVDESLADPAPVDDAPEPIDRLSSLRQTDPGTVAVVALGLVAVVTATMTAATIASPAALVGLVAVVVGVVVATYLLVEQDQDHAGL